MLFLCIYFNGCAACPVIDLSITTTQRITISKRSMAEDRSNEDSNSEAERDHNSKISGKIDGSEQKTNDENPQTTEEALAFVRDLQNKILYLNSTGESYRKIIADYEREQLARSNTGKREQMKDQKEIARLANLLNEFKIQLVDIKQKLINAETEMKELKTIINCKKEKMKTVEEGDIFNNPDPTMMRTNPRINEVIQVVDTTTAQFDPIDYLKEIATFSGKINSSLSFEE